MLNGPSFKNFIDEVVAPNTTNKLRIDQYGNFRVKFIPISGDFATDNFKNYGTDVGISGGSLGKQLFNNENLHQFIKSINDVEMSINARSLELTGASYAIHRLLPMNNPSTIKMSWLNTKYPFIETVFVPWMQDNTINEVFPLVKADLEITFPMIYSPNGQQIRYRYYGVRPVEVGLHKMTNEPVTDFYRNVTFDFDYFYVFTDGETKIGDRKSKQIK